MEETTTQVEESDKKQGVPGWLSWLSVWPLISAQVMISGFMSLSPTSGSALTVWSLFRILILSCGLKTNELKKKKKNCNSDLEWAVQSQDEK